MSVDPKTNLQPSISKIRRIKEEQDLNSLNKIVPGKQDQLVPGVNIKRINGVSLVGGGNIDTNSYAEENAYTFAIIMG